MALGRQQAVGRDLWWTSCAQSTCVHPLTGGGTSLQVTKTEDIWLIPSAGMNTQVHMKKLQAHTDEKIKGKGVFR
jgi:hypothetical protein